MAAFTDHSLPGCGQSGCSLEGINSFSSFFFTGITVNNVVVGTFMSQLHPFKCHTQKSCLLSGSLNFQLLIVTFSCDLSQFEVTIKKG